MSDVPYMRRVTNPVKPSLFEFGSGGEEVSEMRRLTNPVKPTVCIFVPPPMLWLTITYHLEANKDDISRLAAQVIDRANACDRELGGTGLVYLPSRSREEPGQLVLCLLPSVIDGACTARMAELTALLSRLADEARRKVVEVQEADQLQLIEQRLGSLPKEVSGVTLT